MRGDLAMVKLFVVLVCGALLGRHTATSSIIPANLKAEVDTIVGTMAKKYDCAVAVGIRRPSGVPSETLAIASAAGVTDRRNGRKCLETDPFVWGSVTKVVTGTAVLRLVDQNVISLEDPITKHVDPFLAKSAAKDPKAQNFTSLQDLWGPEIHKATVRDCLGMTSGIPDYDTASPSGHRPTDSFRADAYAHPDKSYTPIQLISVPWARTGKLLFTPGKCDREKYGNCYSSTNYVVLGLLLAHHAGVETWDAYQQMNALSSQEEDFKDGSGIQFAVTGPPSRYTPVRGYDTTHYNNNTKAIDVADVAGVYGGWTASDFTTDALNAAALVQDVYGPEYKLISKGLVDQMYGSSGYTGYGLSTFNLTRLTPNDIAYGHLGATYGYQSIVVYIPSVDLSISIGTNIERDYQDQPQDIFCSVYNTVKAMILGQKKPTCTFKPGYYDAGCKCV